MKLNQVPVFRVEDYPSESAWIGKFFVSLNPFLQTVKQLLDNNVEYSNNIKAVSRDYTISTFQAFSFIWPFSDAIPIDCRVVKATKGTQQTACFLIAVWSFDSSTNTISVSRMTEILDSSVAPLSGQYRFTLRATV